MACLFCGQPVPTEKLQQLKKRERELESELNNVAQEIAVLESGYCGVYCAVNAEDPEQEPVRVEAQP